MRAMVKLGGIMVVAAITGGAMAAVPDTAPPRVRSTGTATVHDADTLRIGSVKMRLGATDAAELRQPCTRAGLPALCGVEARDALRRLVDGQDVTCTEFGRDRYRRALVRCTVLGVDLEAALLGAGATFVYPRARAADRAARAPMEAAARAAALGVWAPDVVIQRPWDWRAGERAKWKKSAQTNAVRDAVNRQRLNDA